MSAVSILVENLFRIVLEAERDAAVRTHGESGSSDRARWGFGWLVGRLDGSL